MKSSFFFNILETHRAELCDTSGILTSAMALNLKDRDDKGHDTIKKNGRIGRDPHSFTAELYKISKGLRTAFEEKIFIMK